MTEKVQNTTRNKPGGQRAERGTTEPEKENQNSKCPAGSRTQDKLGVKPQVDAMNDEGGGQVQGRQPIDRQGLGPSG